MSAPLPEVWLRGPLPNVPALLQPVAHALFQASEELESALRDFPESLLWTRPGNVASVGFHLQHLSGVLDRLVTYARGEGLTETQLASLGAEGKPDPTLHASALLRQFQERVLWVVGELPSFPDAILTEPRPVGRARMPSTVLGLLFHAAEHTQRHLGQLLVTIRLQKG